MYKLKQFILSLIFSGAVLLQPVSAQKPVFESDEAARWADSVIKTMSPDQRLAQLFMVDVYSKDGTKPSPKVEHLIKNVGIGGLIFMKGGPGRQVVLTNHYQKMARLPLLISIDGEWGLPMRLDSSMAFPYQMTLGAIRNNKLIVEMGEEIARQCLRIGVHMNLAPSIDVNNNPANPVIKARSFGDRPQDVAEKGLAYAQGMQNRRVIASAKHFPGHGDTDTDSHLALPLLPFSRARLDSIELLPFRELIKGGVSSVMVAHLAIPALDPSKVPATVSPKIVQDLLIRELGYQGLIITDAMNMKGVADKYAPGEADLRAFLAGNDILLFSRDVEKGMASIRQAVENGQTTQEEIDRRCKKVLMAKYWSGLYKFRPISLQNLHQDLHTPEAEMLLRRLTAASLTLIRNQENLIPFKKLNTLRIASLAIDGSVDNMFQRRLKDYAPVQNFRLSSGQMNIQDISAKTKDVNLWIISIHQPGESPFKTPVIKEEVKQAIRQLTAGKEVVLVLFANPYALRKYSLPANFRSVLVAYQDNEISQDLSAQLLFGAIGANGKLPVTISSEFPTGHGLRTEGGLRLRFGLPEESGFDRKKLDTVERMVENAIKEKTFPGCQILVAQKGNIFYRRSFGYHTYEKKQKVEDHHLYDLASITKVAGTLPGIMYLVSTGELDLNSTLGTYLPELKGTDKANVKLRDLLTHQAGFKAWIPFHKRALDAANKWKPGWFSATWSEEFPHKVADGMYACQSVQDSILKENIRTPLGTSKTYLYSDLGYYFLQQIVMRKTKYPLDEFIDRFIAGPLGAYSMTYNPLNKFELEDITPTELDHIFRKQLVHGYVHDQGAALMGGVAGHAGLFSNATDLAKLLQLYLNWGEYAGERYVNASVVKEFAKCQFCANGNRRGIGFDRPTTNGSGGTACDCVSFLSFGHSGFTGTLAWVDPEYDLIYVFLSNRIHPDAENKKLIQSNLRAKVQSVFYGAMNSFPRLQEEAYSALE